MKKLVLYWIQYKKNVEIQCWLLLTFFICLHNQWSCFNPIIMQMSEKRGSLNWQQNWMFASFSNFTTKLEFFYKTVLEIFKIVLRLRDRHVFRWQSVKVSNVFNTWTLKQIFWKTKTFFKKLEYRFLVEATKIENTSCPFKTAVRSQC